jgi:ApaG protein
LITETTDGIKISVKPDYEGRFSTNKGLYFFFRYMITIENRSKETVQLVQRHWHIFDSLDKFSEVEGLGVVGEQPVIQPGDSHSYTSGCYLRSNLGSMDGAYMMKRMNGRGHFEVIIPRFNLIAPFTLN